MSFSSAEIFAINDVLNARVADYLRLARKLRGHNSEKLIHDFRVSSRRLLAIEPLLASQSSTRFWRQHARRLLKTLNPLRDLQVLQQRFAAHDAINYVICAKIAQAQAGIANLKHAGLGHTFKERLLMSLKRYCQACEAAPEYASDTMLAHWRATRDSFVECLTAIDYGELSTLHRLRVKYKSLRYMLELLCECGLVDDQECRQLKHWQDLLGEIHDIEVAIDWLQSIDADQELRRQLESEMQDNIALFQQQEGALRRFAEHADELVRRLLAK